MRRQGRREEDGEGREKGIRGGMWRNSYGRWQRENGRKWLWGRGGRGKVLEDEKVRGRKSEGNRKVGAERRGRGRKRVGEREIDV